MIKLNAKEKKVVTFLSAHVMQEIGGYENGLMDGEEGYTEEGLEKFRSLENAVAIAKAELEYSIRTGSLKDPESFEVVEAKHLKFMGNYRLEELTVLSAIIGRNLI